MVYGVDYGGAPDGVRCRVGSTIIHLTYVSTRSEWNRPVGASSTHISLLSLEQILAIGCEHAWVSGHGVLVERLFSSRLHMYKKQGMESPTPVVLDRVSDVEGES